MTSLANCNTGGALRPDECPSIRAMSSDGGASRVRARVHTFHVDPSVIDGVSSAVDLAMATLIDHPDFRGLLFLERDGTRCEILAITLWADDGLVETEPEAERSRRQIARTTDLGVSTKHYDVLRFASSDAPERRPVDALSAFN